MKCQAITAMFQMTMRSARVREYSQEKLYGKDGTSSQPIQRLGEEADIPGQRNYMSKKSDKVEPITTHGPFCPHHQEMTVEEKRLAEFLCMWTINDRIQIIYIKKICLLGRSRSNNKVVWQPQGPKDMFCLSSNSFFFFLN